MSWEFPNGGGDHPPAQNNRNTQDGFHVAANGRKIFYDLIT